jgi:transposase
MLVTLNEQVKALTTQISEQLTLHADQHVFPSLPRSCRVHAARLLAEIGAVPASPPPSRWPAWPESPPPPASPARFCAVGFRWACDKQLRDAVTDFADDSRRANPRAAKFYDDAIARGHDHPHAVCILARAWLYVIWHCWQDGVAYDPARHKALQRILAEQKSKAARTQGYSWQLPDP